MVVPLLQSDSDQTRKFAPFPILPPLFLITDFTGPAARTAVLAAGAGRGPPFIIGLLRRQSLATVTMPRKSSLLRSDRPFPAQLITNDNQHHFAPHYFAACQIQQGATGGTEPRRVG